MSDRTIQLKPFLTETSIPNIKITSFCRRQNQQLKISYLLEGDLSQILLPSPTTQQVQRKDELWQTTCFEFFLAIFNSPEYWEFNLSPTGDWNVYHFTNYRRGMKEAKTFQNFPFQILSDSFSYKLSTEINLQSIASAATPLDLAITAVIEDVNHNISYWAITHPGNQADFHRRDSFIKL